MDEAEAGANAPLAWVADALADLDRRDLLRSLRHHGSGADAWLELDGGRRVLHLCSNGYLGLRGNVEEGRDTYAHGTFVNGFHETWPIRHAEEAFGLARVGQTIVNVPDPKTIKLYVDDEPLLVSTADLEHYERTLDFRAGLLRRSVVWRTSAGKRVKITSSRMASVVGSTSCTRSWVLSFSMASSKMCTARLPMSLIETWTLVSAGFT